MISFRKYFSWDFWQKRSRWLFYSVISFFKFSRDFSYPARADRIRTHINRAEKFLLHRLGREVPEGGRALEIGSFHGASALCIVSAMTEGAKLYCVDTFFNDATSESREDVFPVFEKALSEFNDRIIVVRGFSSEMADQIQDQLDLLFIDGDHSREGVISDLRLYLPKMKTNAALVMHDICWGGSGEVFSGHVLPYEIKRKALLPNFYAGVCDYQKILESLNG